MKTLGKAYLKRVAKRSTPKAIRKYLKDRAKKR
jgi:hypothetical protein